MSGHPDWCPDCARFTNGDCGRHNAPSAPQPYKCPVCDGSGKVSRPPHVAGDLPTFTSSSCGPWPCNACAGTGVLWR